MNNPTALRELTLRGMILGALITVVFTASNVYLGLKVGMTFASSIPAAVISMAVLKMFQGSNILENNMVQTQASSAGTLSSVIFVIPALLMMGYWQSFPFWQTLLICISGGILGVIFTVPLRNVMVVKSDLPYPEGVAAAEILKAGDESNNKDSGIKEIVSGGLLAASVSFLTNGLRVVADGASYWFKGGNAIFQVPMGFSFALLGAGYLVGMMGGIAMLVGTLFTWGVAVPYFTATTPMPADADMVSFATGLWKSNVRFIGVGTIAIAAIWTLLVLFKPMVQGMSQAFRALKDPSMQSLERTAQDLSPKTMIYTVLASIALIIVALVSFLQPVGLSMELAFLLVVVCTILAVIVGFLVAAASGYMAGLVGSSSSPISGIGIISIVIISVILMMVGNAAGLMETADGQRFLTALTIFTASIVFCVSTISNDNLQDLKTGYLVKATPWRQQFALIIGCIVGALVITPVLEILYHAYGFAGAMPREGMDAAQALSAPQATIMMTISNGIFSNSLEWTYILVGVAFGICLIIVDTLLKKASAGRLGLPTLAVGIGIYLPPVVNVPLIIGATLSWLVNRHIKRYAKRSGKDVETTSKKAERYGTLFAAGLIVGESLVGVLLAFVIAGSVTSGGSDAPLALNLENWGGMAELLGLTLFAIGCIIFARRVLQAKK
ncbi:OPT family oligopeptide transporter [Actinobacillus pleuropneumoniae]|uniref:Putative oligopeptide transporter n=1 Tax=Actinobacillus pleuropneumoniae TaxID=715 RepID=A0A448U1Q5_ACTPL|nr:oligopeptide transporter, OPT family [Actinobacillus pleuropneumoniae]MEE3619104.1 oligopeptide transporter, OPT family [Actinobacillus pleuropneumoniae]UKH07883.1 oligopeptide transporter, OPT family [Actinobacillus pleuropneumoniae]UKH46426.1 oligopeptide transporter, OPT family [Actinobacillus pleuropneumoniae serovar 2 str. S1536]VEJ17731.1 putative oligopeptide transporter [Actinobacillus pleuropneumoniae]